MNEAMVVVDTEGRIAFANQRLSDICRTPPRELVGRPVAPRRYFIEDFHDDLFKLG